MAVGPAQVDERDRSADPRAHAQGIDDVLRASGVDAERGLTADEAAARLARHGRNELAEAPRELWWRRFARQFNDLVIWILLAAAVIAGVSGERLDAVVILAIVVLNGVIGFLQEGRAESALAALRQMSSPHAKVLRDGRLHDVEAALLVPGDVIELEAGDRVPADVRLIRAAGLRVQEAALTGESVPVDKDARAEASADAALGDRANMAYMSTNVVAGAGRAVVVATGMETEIGRIAGMLEQQPSEPTPLQRRLAELGRTLLVVVLGIVAVIFVLHAWRGEPLLEVLLVSVSLAVAAVPEGMPAVVTIALAIGVQRMARRNALVRRLPSVETLGAVTTICSDKTGTLTRNEMTVRRILASDRWYAVTGGGYAPAGEFRRASADDVDGKHDAGQDERVDPAADGDLVQLLAVGALCNHAQVNRHERDHARWELVGDPTEGALLVAAMKAGLDLKHRDHDRVHEIPFDSERKAMSVIARDDGGFTMYSKGAPEVILKLCTRERRDGREEPLDDDRRRAILDAAGQMAADALRVLALAYRTGVDERDERESDFVLAGLAGMIDPPRDEARDAVARCKSAGIRPVMITGDHPDTARAIAVDLGIAESRSRVLRNSAAPGHPEGGRGVRPQAPHADVSADLDVTDSRSPDAADLVVTGQQLEKTSAKALAERVEQIPVYARVSAEHKLRIIDALRRRRHVVAMTGDGVNDAPAVKAADIGIAMGVTGTDVTKEASDMVLTDDNFASIVNAVEEGRTIFDNIRKFVHYLLATNAGEVMTMFFAALVGWPTPLFPIQILWINLVTDALPALALGMEPPEPDVMSRPPRPTHERVVTRAGALQILAHGLLIAAAASIAYWLVYRGDDARLTAARTACFATLAYSQLMYAIGCRSHRFTMPQLGFTTNHWLLGAILVSGLLQLAVLAVPMLQPLFKTAPAFSAWEIAAFAGLALAPVTIIEIVKIARAAGRTAES